MPNKLILESSGSTGEPKRILRSVESWTESVLRETEVFCLNNDERYAVAGSPSHSLWAYVHFRANYEQQPCLGISKFQSHAFKRLYEAKPSVLYSTPQIAALCTATMVRDNQVVPSLHRLLLGGAALPENFPWDSQKKVFPNAQVWMFYGTAETSFIGYGEPREPYRLFPDVEIKIDKAQHLWVKSPMTVCPDQWIHTGDLVQWTNQRLKIIGRSQRQVIAGGKKFPVEPIENFLEKVFKTDRVAIVQSCTGALVCVLVPNDQTNPKAHQIPQGLSSYELNKVIQHYFEGFPEVKGSCCLQVAQWPVSKSGKTDWKAMQRIIDNLPV